MDFNQVFTVIGSLCLHSPTISLSLSTHTHAHTHTHTHTHPPMSTRRVRSSDRVTLTDPCLSLVRALSSVMLILVS